jgi:solute carrier family 6 (neurotransmitter transporter, GABA) member 1
LLFLFLFRAISLTGASDGVAEYVGKFDGSVLSDRPDVWSTAVSQCFFSLSITMGTMTAYGSGCPRHEPAFINTCVIAASDTMFSFISGFAVFAALGHLAYLQGVTVDDIPYAGFSLVFGTWPVVFGTLKGGEHWVRLLFFNLLLLGIDSAFSITESPLAVIMDVLRKKGMSTPKWKVTAILVAIAYVCTLIYGKFRYLLAGAVA